MIIVGLTGGIASGKSTVADIFKELGAYLIDFDVLAREVVRPYLKAWKGIVEHFGTAVLNEDSTINRGMLAEMVFNDAARLQKLNEIVHPAVLEEDEQRMEEIRRIDPAAIVIKDIPLLLEMDYREFVDKVVLVNASEENQMKRLIDRGLDPEGAAKRIGAQMPLAEKVKLADFVIQNNGSLAETRRQVEVIYDALKGARAPEARGKR
ncbi:MAG: Dephospho-CoA kinase [Dehalococcoidia bacterium]|nr:Dephospho-CoA kinase [Chloroflexota bacterium]MBT9158997.1 Dephospho-CoA kinase [Chloroflexota bacterium]MBT9162779.1 Dephospho-CoA kinase [Chloroflexota bacterium]